MDERRSPNRVAVAAFDTRYHMPLEQSGSATHEIAPVLRDLGGELLFPPESFFVLGGEGPPHVSLLVAGRELPVLSLAKLVVDGEMTCSGHHGHEILKGRVQRRLLRAWQAQPPGDRQ